MRISACKSLLQPLKARTHVYYLKYVSKHQSALRTKSNAHILKKKCSDCVGISTFQRPLSSELLSTGTLIPHVTKQIPITVAHRRFHTSPRRDVPPLLWAVASKVFQFSAIIGGRTWRKWLKKQPKNVRDKHNSRSLRVMGLVAAGFMGLGVYYYFNHRENVPVTGRRRFLWITREQSLKVADFEAEQFLSQFESNLLPATHPVYEKVVRIAQQIVRSNQGFPGLQEHSWVIHVVKDSTKNAFVLPNGHIFVCTGMLEFCDSVDQFAIVLAHEMAHALLQHGAEQMTWAQLVDHLVILVMLVIWFFMPNDGIAAITHWFYKKVLDIFLHLPYSRTLENEADEIGLLLAAKACFDVREATLLWRRMEMADKLEGGIPSVEWLSTHPTHENRAKTLNKLLPAALEERECAKCPMLPEVDPRVKISVLKEMTDNALVHRATRANLQHVALTKAKPRPSVPQYQPQHKVQAVETSVNISGKSIVPDSGSPSLGVDASSVISTAGEDSNETPQSSTSSATGLDSSVKPKWFESVDKDVDPAPEIGPLPPAVNQDTASGVSKHSLSKLETPVKAVGLDNGTILSEETPEIRPVQS